VCATRWGGAAARCDRSRCRAGEIVGVAGVSGNGQSELLEVLSGLLAPTPGTLAVGGPSFAPAPGSTRARARTLGVAHVPEDRHERAMVMSFEAWESAVLGYEWLAALLPAGLDEPPADAGATVDMMERFDVRPRNAALISASFSGGNQQKLVLARELGPGAQVLLVGQPTRGVDIGAIEFIYSQLRAMRDAGCAVLVVSSELDEILALADRVIVMNQGRIAGELPMPMHRARLGMLMIGGGGRASAARRHRPGQRLSHEPAPLPRWADLVVLPMVNLAVALLAGVRGGAGRAGPAGGDPGADRRRLRQQRGLSYTLYYATTFIFTGLAVAVAFHGGLFNIGGEGQAILGGLGTGLVALWLSPSLLAWADAAADAARPALFGMVWAAVPGALQAWRGSHIVITTIMFNFLASSLLVYLLVNVLKVPGSMAVETARLRASAKLPSMHQLHGRLGIDWPRSPLNTSVLLAVVACGRRSLPVAHPRGLRPARHRAAPDAAALRRHPPQAPGDGGDGGVGRAGRHGRHERDGRRARPADARIRQSAPASPASRWPDGAQPSFRHRAGQPAVRRAVPGRRRGEPSRSRASAATWS
jgi:ABC-type branched-subunit amino acid transport system ATPase component